MFNRKKPVPYFDIADTRPASILTNSKIVLATLFSDLKIDFQPWISPDKAIFELKGTGASSCQVEESRYIVYPVKINQEETFLLNLGIKFSRTSKTLFLFSGVSLRIFKFTSDMIINLFRAEWDAVSEEGIHAQPHWHVNFLNFKKDEAKMASGEEFKGEGVQVFTEVLERESFGTEDLNCFSKFHFAMSADWHDTGKHSIRIKDEKALANWLQGCLKYTIEQLKYVVKHHSHS